MGLAIANSLISLYYYLNVIRQMYIEEPEDRSPLSVAPLTTGVLALLLAGMLFVGVYPGPLLDLVDAARDVLPPFLPIR